MVKLHGFVYMLFFFRGFSRFRCCNIHFLQKKNDRMRRSEAFEASLGDQATGGAEGGTFGDGILKKRG